MKTLFCVIGQLGNGGTERQMHLFLKNLDRTLFLPIVVVTSNSDGIWRQEIEKLGIEIIFLGACNPVLKMLKFRWLVWKRQPDTIFSWSFFTNAFYLMRGHASFIGSLRQQFSYTQTELSSQRMKTCLLPRHLIVNSSYIASELEKYGAQNNIHIIFNIVESTCNSESSSPEAIRQQYNIPDDKTIIAGIGRDSPSKNFPFFVSTIEQLTAKCRNIHVILIGSGGIAVKQLIEQKGLSSFFTLTGEIPNAKRILSAVDIFFLSSDSEGLANVLVEAVDAECACVATDVGGVRDILSSDNSRGTVIAKRNEVEAVDALVNFIANPELRKSCCEKAKTQLKQFSADKTMARYYSVLNNTDSA